jgi:hypothetical protein
MISSAVRVSAGREGPLSPAMSAQRLEIVRPPPILAVFSAMTCTASVM